ncbi:MAG: hypothetical protein OXM61_17355 [Candidatus Poribacteria bacterium]|nr:hypothetical protein [Candidatus Poribacteria bacterium]
MTYKAGQKVITPTDTQGFVSAVFTDGIFDVGILEENGEVTYLEFHFNDGVHIAVDQRPQMDDITPLGKITGTRFLREGIIAVCTEGLLRYAGLWLSDDRMAYLEGFINLTFHHWASLKDFDEVLEYFDLHWDEGHIVFKGLEHHAIPEDAEIEVMFESGRTEKWGTVVDGEGNIVSVTTSEGEQIHNLATFRDTGIIDANLIPRYTIKDF